MTLPRYLLYTNILSVLVRHPQGKVAQLIAARGEATVCTWSLKPPLLYYDFRVRRPW